MPESRVSHTADLDAARRDALRAMLDSAFEGRFDDHDWEHALGGLHVMVWHGSEPIAHASVVQRRLLYHGQALRTGYVEAVAVAPAWRGKGFGASIMDGAERIVRSAYDLGALSSSHKTIMWYARRGWLRWQGPTSVLAPDGSTRTPEEDDSTFVLTTPRTVHMRPTEPLACDWRDGDVW